MGVSRARRIARTTFATPCAGFVGLRASPRPWSSRWRSASAPTRRCSSSSTGSCSGRSRTCARRTTYTASTCARRCADARSPTRRCRTRAISTSRARRDHFRKSRPVSDWRFAVGTGQNTHVRHVDGVSASFFDFFDAPPVRGRYFNSAEDAAPNGTRVAVLAYALWQSEFGGRNVVGESLQIGLGEVHRRRRRSRGIRWNGEQRR